MGDVEGADKHDCWVQYRRAKASVTEFHCVVKRAAGWSVDSMALLIVAVRPGTQQGMLSLRECSGGINGGIDRMISDERRWIYSMYEYSMHGKSSASRRAAPSVLDCATYTVSTTTTVARLG